MNFVDFARDNGVEIDNLYPSDKIQRCGTVEKPRSKHGAYFWDGKQGWVKEWSGEARTVWYDDPSVTPWTEEEKRLWAVKRASAATARQQQHEKVAKQAEIDIKACVLATPNYLVFKGFAEETGLIKDGKFLIPMRNILTNKVQGYQLISYDDKERIYIKKMLYGMSARNAVFWMGQKDAKECWFVEGYATGLSVRKALKTAGIPASVVVCFSASNLVAVADQVGGRRFVFADNDASETGQQAAQETGLPWVMPDTVGHDANDLHQQGLFKLVAKIMVTRNLVE